jgi:hypothetical protein
MTQGNMPRSPFSDWFDYVYTYFYSPTSNLQHAFSPTINFGCNLNDAPTEQHVVNSVGSYGFQLNRVLDALSVCLDHVTLDGVSPEEIEKLKAFKRLAQKADDAAKEFKGRATAGGVRKLLESLQELQRSGSEADLELYHTLRKQILTELVDKQ